MTISKKHCYRDSIVSELGGTYERTAFGAYVLFPWKDDEGYKQHQFYRSIDKVNIGGLPFLPNNTSLVEQIIDNLLNKNADELHREGILPRGTISYLKEKQQTFMLVVPAVIADTVREPILKLSREQLTNEWEQVTSIALVDFEGVKEIGKIISFELTLDEVIFRVESWKSQSQIKKVVSYPFKEPVVIIEQSFDEAEKSSEMLVKHGKELELVRMFRRMGLDFSVKLSDPEIMRDTYVTDFIIGDFQFKWHDGVLSYGDEMINMNTVPIYEVFKRIQGLIVRG